MRALLALFAMDVQYTRMRIVNDDAKTVVRLLCEDGTLAEAKDALPFASCLWLKPVRGYEKEAKRFAKWLTNKGWTLSLPTSIFRDSRRSRNTPVRIPPKSAYNSSRLCAPMKQPKSS